MVFHRLLIRKQVTHESFFITKSSLIYSNGFSPFGDHFGGPPLSMYAKFSEKLTFLASRYPHVRVRIRGLEMLVFRKILRTY